MSTLFSGHYLRNRSTLDIGVLGYISIVQHKEHSPEVLSIPPGTPCISPTCIPSIQFLLNSPAANIRCFHPFFIFFSEVPSQKIYHNLEQRYHDFKSYKCKFVLQTGNPSSYQRTWRAFRRRTISPHSGIGGTPMR